MRDLETQDPEGTGRGDAILVSLPPPEGMIVAAALRERGAIVTEAPLHVLAVRALSEIPRVMVVDVDLLGAVEAIERTREVAAAALVCVGDPARAAELGASGAIERVFARPLDVDALVRFVLGTEPVDQGARGTLPPTVSRLRESSAPRGLDSEAPPSSDVSGDDLLDPGVLLPTLDEAEGAAVVASVELSPELLHILESAERRVSALGWSQPSSVPPDEDVDRPLSPDILASLDEPLDPDDDSVSGDSSTGGTGGTGPRSTTGSRPGVLPGSTTGAARGPTGPVGSHPGGQRARTSRDTGATTGTGRAPPTGVGLPPAAMPPFGPPPARSLVQVTDADPRDPPAMPPSGRATDPDPPPRPTSPDLLTGADFAPPRVGVVPIPVESLPDRPVPDPDELPTGEGDFHPHPPTAPPPTETFAMGETPKPPPQAFAMGTALRGAPASSTGAALRPTAPVAMGPARIPDAPRPEPLRRSSDVPLPAVLGDGDAVRALSAAIAGRVSGSVALGPDATTRRVVLHDGDIVTAASGSADETLIAFLAARGDLAREVAARLQTRLPAHGRHAGAALIAHGHLTQDDLWPVLRAHAEWILGRALLCDEGTCELEQDPPGRLKAEPSVFGGATGAEVILEVIRRVVPPDVARRRLGGATARLAEGPRRQLLVECALRPEDEQIVRGAAGRSLGETLAGSEPELADVIYGLCSLGVLEALAPTAPAETGAAAFDPLDEEAIRQRVRARLALVEDGDYFSLLGVPRAATGYEIRRAYLELRRAFEPGRVLTAATADLAADVRLVAEVLDEAYEILREPHRRERYRRAIEAGPP